MKTRHSLLLFMCGAALLACKKFKHELIPVVAPDSCELCTYAETLNGSYRGQPGGVLAYSSSLLYYDSINGYNVIDSVRMTFEHVYLDRGPYVDSTIMFMKVTNQAIHKGTIWYDTIEITDNSGYVYHHSADDYFYLTPDTLIIYEYSYGKYGDYLKYAFYGTRE